MLQNPRFSGGWYHPAGPEQQIPDGWTYHNRGAGISNPFDDEPWSVFRAPEIRVLTPALLPPDEWPLFVSPENTQVLKPFLGYGAWNAGLAQPLALHGAYIAHVELFADLVAEYTPDGKVWAPDPTSGLLRLRVDGTPVTYWQYLTAGARAGYDIPFTGYGDEVEFEFMLPYALANSGLFISLLDLTPAQTCRGLPREDYARVVNVLPQTANLARFQEVCTAAYPQRQTVGFSYDDAGIGDLLDKAARLWDIPAGERPAYEEFFARFYPGTRVEFAGAEPPPPPPPSPPDGIRPAGTRGNILLHWIPTTAGGVGNFLTTIQPPAIKVVTTGGGGPQLLQARAWSPETLLVYRRVEDYLNVYNPAQAAEMVQRYLADLAPHFNLSDFSGPPIYVVSINEKYECGHAQQNAACAAWDMAFMSAIEATGLNLRGVVYTAPVGNPEPNAADLEPLLPMVAQACAGGHLLGKHSYYASVPNQPNFYRESWEWYGGRFAKDDQYFRSQGLAPLWMLGEGGACEATVHPNGTVSLNPGGGWKNCGSVERYRDELLWCEAQYAAWNAAHGDRLLGVALFTTGGWGWDRFALQGGDLDVVTAGLAGVL